MKKGIIILGSSNSNGETKLVSTYISKETDFSIIDLKTMNIGEFDYEFKNDKDDFHPLMKKIVNNFDIILFATPVYWYTMSGIMKTFFDRSSDLLRVDKDTGRRFRGKQMAAISSTNSPDKFEGFFIPFKLSAEYLGVTYLGDINVWVPDENKLVTEEVKLLLDNFEKTQLTLT